MRQIVFLFMFFSVTMVFAVDQNQIVTRSQFEDLSIQGGGVNINNFSIREDTSFWDRNLRVIRVSFSARNRNAVSKQFAIMLVGFDESDNLLWSMNLEPMMGAISENQTEDISGSVYISQGTLNRTKKIWYRIIGNF